MRRHPHLYENNARIFLRRVSDKYYRNLTLATIPDEEWQSLVRQGFDLLWPMGVWQRSPGAREQALVNEFLRREYDRVLPDWIPEDVAGSPYAIYNYSLDPALGKRGDLVQLKSRLNHFGLGLILDFVPNHLASDHPWVLAHPEWFVQGQEADARTHPDWFFSPVSDIYLAHVKDPNLPPWPEAMRLGVLPADLAHGRDPNFPPWGDTVQVNFFSREMRRALIDELLQIAEVADGVRCDMAMLALNEVFERVWGDILKNYPRPPTEFWADAIGQVREKRPDFLFLAEAYWGLEGKLQQLGFDFTYDKLLYDRLRYAAPDDIQRHLMADSSYQERSVRFIENHDEPRAAVAFGRERSLAAALIMATIPGLRLFHDGQFEGCRIRLPVQLVREPREAADREMLQFYERLLAITSAPAFHEGEWQLLPVSRAWEDNKSYHNMLAWSWRSAKDFKVVVVNYSPHQSQCWLPLPLPPEITARIIFKDELTGMVYVRDLAEVSRRGLYVDLEPYHAHVLDTMAGG
jgi:glycosidase